MSVREAAIDAAVERLTWAAFDPSAWRDVLRHLARATDSSFAELIGWVDNQTPVHQLHNLDPEGLGGWVALGGPDPRHNPLVRRGIHLPVYGTVADHDVIDADARRASALWRGFMEPQNIPHLCSAKAWARDERHLMLGVLRTRQEGPIDEAQRSALRRITVAAGGVAALGERLAADGARMIAGALEAVGAPVFVLDGFGLVLASTPAAETLLAAGDLRLTGRRLRARSTAADRGLQAALRRLRGDGRGALLSIRVRIGAPGSPGWPFLRFACLPQSGFDWGVGARFLAVLEPERLEDLGLTPAETAVARSLLEGVRARDIAMAKGVSAETVRTQIKAVYAKTNVSDQAGLMARFGGR